MRTRLVTAQERGVLRERLIKATHRCEKQMRKVMRQKPLAMKKAQDMRHEADRIERQWQESRVNIQTHFEKMRAVGESVDLSGGIARATTRVRAFEVAVERSVRGEKVKGKL